MGNRPNNMFDMDAFNQNQQRTNSFNQIDGQRMQYRMDTNQRNPMTQMTQLNQRNQFYNRRFKRYAESDFVSYRTMTETPTRGATPRCTVIPSPSTSSWSKDPTPTDTLCPPSKDHSTKDSPCSPPPA